MTTTDTPITPDDAETAPAHVHEASRPLLGIALVIGATALFALNDSANKFLVSEFPVPAVAATRYIVHCLVMIAILGPVQGRRLVQTRRTGLVLLRSICLVVATLFFGLALQHMPVAETTAIVYLAPMLVVLLARPLLGERIGLVGWISTLLGFCGVLLIVRPGGGLDPIGIVLALSNVGFSVVYYLLSRVLAASEKTLTLLFYTALIGAICFGLALPWFWFDHAPTLLQLVLMLSLGVTAGMGHFLFTAAYRYAQASLLAPVTYMHLLWAGLSGWLVFGHVPEGLTIAGMVIIAAAGVLIALRTRFAKV
ncbi:DMT family transporter [Devosia sp.]|uniref:DMT family transporter n=1 Tax=Devosia sp. TaxID=1871048 RepID=UPI003263215D